LLDALQVLRRRRPERLEILLDVADAAAAEQVRDGAR